MFHGGPGTGKSTLAKIIINAIGVDSLDLLSINGSRETGIDFVREKVYPFSSTMPFGSMKIVLIEECDGLSAASQRALREIMETYETSVRYILTCNYPHKVLPALKSRVQELNIAKLDEVEYTSRMATILCQEEIDFDLDTLDQYVDACYPDLRKCINLCEQNCLGGKLSKLDTQSVPDADWLQAIELFEARKLKDARQIICRQINDANVEEFITWCYTNLHIWGNTDEEQDAAVLVIRKAAVQVSLVANIEILVSAMLVELSHIKKD